MTHPANEWRDQSHASLRTCDGLGKAKEEGEIAVNALVALELARSLDAFPGRCDLDEHTFSLDSEGLVERNELFGLGLGCLLVKGETGIDFGGDTAGNDSKDLFTEFDELQCPREWESLGEIYAIEFTRRSVAASTCSWIEPPFCLP
jgi:hypothetical protein